MTKTRIAEIRKYVLLEVEAPANQEIIGELLDEIERLKDSVVILSHAADAIAIERDAEAAHLARARRLLWSTHGCVGKYGDDGELQCGHCRVDFKRQPIAEIEAAIQRRGVERFAKEQADAAIAEAAEQMGLPSPPPQQSELSTETGSGPKEGAK